MADRQNELYPLIFSSEFLDTMAAGVVLQDGDGAIIDCNEAAVAMIGATVDKVVGRTSLDSPWRTVHEDGSLFVADELPTMVTLRTGERCSDVIMGFDYPKQARRWLAINTCPLTLDGHTKGVVSSFYDISHRIQREHLLRLLNEVNRLVMITSNEADFLQLVCTVFVEVGGFALATISVADSDEDGDIKTPYAAGAIGFRDEGMGSRSGSKTIWLGPTGTALRTGATQVANDLTTHPGVGPWRERAERFGINSAIAIPLVAGDQRAVLTLCDPQIVAFDESMVEGLGEVAKGVEAGVAHVRLITEMETALGGTIAAMAYMTETHDPYTAGHQQNVGSLGAAIASRMGLDTKMIDLVRHSGQVHDIGKIAVPAEILTRPGQPSPLEFEMTKSHTLVGHDILSRASLPFPVAEVALQHHERMDGSGYPNGISGNEMILPARIIAVADVVEAMTEARPYRLGLGIDEALAEVAAGAGTLFDADVVRACHAVFEAGFTFSSQAAGPSSY